MHSIDVGPADETAHMLFHLGLDAGASYGDIGKHRAVAQGPYIQITMSGPQAATRKKAALQSLLLGFYRECGLLDLDRQLVARRLGQFGELLIVTQFAEFYDMSSDAEISKQLQAANEEFARFTAYLKQQMRSTSSESAMPAARGALP